MTRVLFLRFLWITLAAACLTLNPGAGRSQQERTPDRIVHVTGPSVPLELPTPEPRGFLNRWLDPELSVTVLEVPDHGQVTLGEENLRRGQPIDPNDLWRLRYESEDFHPRPGSFVYEVRDRWRVRQAVIALNARPRDFVSVLDEPMELTPGASHEFRFALAPPEDGDPTTLSIYAVTASGRIDMHDGADPHELEIDAYQVDWDGDHWFDGDMVLLAERTLQDSGELHFTYVYEPNLQDPYPPTTLIIMFVAEDIHGATTQEVFVAVDNGPNNCTERLHPTVSREEWMEMIPSFQEDRIQEIFRETGIETSGSWTGSNREIYRGYLHDIYSAADLVAVRKFVGWFQPQWRISEDLADEFRPLTVFAAGTGDHRAMDFMARFSSGSERDMWRFIHSLLTTPGAENLQLNEIDLYDLEHRPWENPFAQWSTERDMTFAIGQKRAWSWLACHLASTDIPTDAD